MAAADLPPGLRRQTYQMRRNCDGKSTIVIGNLGTSTSSARQVGKGGN